MYGAELQLGHWASARSDTWFFCRVHNGFGPGLKTGPASLSAVSGPPVAFTSTTHHSPLTSTTRRLTRLNMVLPVRRVLIADGISSLCGDLLRQHDLHVTEVGKLSKEELLKHLETHDTLLVRSATKVTSDVIDAAPGLRLVGRAGTGVDNIDLEAATRHGVLVMNTPGGNTISAAEHTCVMIISLSRNLYSACDSLKHAKWERGKFLGSELYGKTLAVIGLGRIGREVSQRMQAFGMKIIGYDPMVSAEAALECGIEKRELDAIWPDADYITVHTPLIPQTRNLIDSTVLSRCRRGVRVVNVARGGIVDEVALLAALESGQCAGAGLDVFTTEPVPNQQLVQHPNVICTPHLGANTLEAQLRVAEEIAEQVVQAATSGQLTGLVNATYLSRAMDDTARPWLHLSQSLGGIIASMSSSSGTRKMHVQITLSGEETKPMSSYLGQAVLVGLMSGVTQNGINLVNAPLLAKEAGITSTVKWQQGDEVTAGVQVGVSSAEGVGVATSSVTGTVQGGTATLQQLNQARFSSGVTLDGNMTFYQGNGSSDTMMSLITGLLEARAQIMTVMTSERHQQGPVLVVRTAEPLSQQCLKDSSNAKFLLQMSF